MPKALSGAEIEQYRRDGYVAPVTVMSPDEAAGFRARLEAFEADQGHPLRGRQRTKGFLLFPWLYRLATWPRLLDAVEDLIGPDILVYQNGAWLKEPSDHAFVSWHQDSTYFGLEPEVLVTAWVALSPSRKASGCVRVLPGSHRIGRLDVEYTEVKPTNLLSSGQRVCFDVDDSRAVHIELEPGQMSLHHTNLIHASGANVSNDRRIGFSVACMPPWVRQGGERMAGALLARGTDTYGHYLPERPPVAEDDPATVAHHADAVEAYRQRVREQGNRNTNRLD